MRKCLLFFCIITMATARAPAQDTASGPPSGPLINSQMPSNAQWSIDYSYTNARKPGVDSPMMAQYKKLALQDPSVAKAMENPRFLNALDPVRPLHVLVTTSGAIRHVETELEGDRSEEAWSDSGITVIKTSGSTKPNIQIGITVVQNDFPEFFWLTPQSFSGIETKNGQKCFVFKLAVDPARIANPSSTGSGGTVPAVAYIDVVTRRPVSLQFGVETREYRMLPTPVQSLVMPDEFAIPAKNEMARQKKLTGAP